MDTDETTSLDDGEDDSASCDDNEDSDYEAGAARMSAGGPANSAPGAGAGNLVRTFLFRALTHFSC